MIRPVKDPTKKRRERILLYSAPGIGKTRFITSLTKRFGKLAYIAADDSSEFLDSVIEQYKDRIYVLKPEGKDPLVDVAEIATMDYRKVLNDPEVKTIVIDTFTALTIQMLSYVANTGQFGGNHVQIGMNTSIKQALPTPGDYGGVHSVIRNFLDALFDEQRDMNIIVVCHEQLDQPEGGGTLGGPATVGKALLRELASNFNTVIRLERKTEVVQKDGKQVRVSRVYANTDAHGYWTARIREGSATGNPMPAVPLDIDPVNFWEKYDSLFYKEAA